MIGVESSSEVLVMISNMSVPICNRSRARRVNNGKTTISKVVTPVLCPHSRGISSPSGTKFTHKKLDNLRYHTVKTRSLYSLSNLGLNRYRVVTDRRTDGLSDRITIANTR